VVAKVAAASDEASTSISPMINLVYDEDVVRSKRGERARCLVDLNFESLFLRREIRVCESLNLVLSLSINSRIEHVLFIKILCMLVLL